MRVEMRQTWGRIIVHPRDRSKWPDQLWVVIHMEDDLGAYMRSETQRLLKSWHKIQSPVWDAHVSVVRGEIQAETGSIYPFDGQEIEVRYSPDIYQAGGHFCVDVETPWIQTIRESLGLSHSPSIPPHMSFGVIVQPSPIYDLTHLLPYRQSGEANNL